MFISKPHRGTRALNAHSCDCRHCPWAVPFTPHTFEALLVLSDNLLNTRIHALGDKKE